jgi:multidrug efflux pump subunit AcrA (membrane-fusion protein)
MSMARAAAASSRSRPKRALKAQDAAAGAEALFWMGPAFEDEFTQRSGRRPDAHRFLADAIDGPVGIAPVTGWHVFRDGRVLKRAGGAAIKDREQSQSDYDQAVAEFERSEARLRAIGIPADQKEQSRLLSVKAPVSGSVIDLQVAPGAFVNDPTAAMMTIANLDTIWVTANVPEKDIAFVFPGQTVNVTFRSIHSVPPLAGELGHRRAVDFDVR